MNLKEGTKIWAIDPCEMKESNLPALIVGKAYDITEVYESGEFTIESEVTNTHFFDIKEFDMYFSLTPPNYEATLIAEQPKDVPNPKHNPCDKTFTAAVAAMQGMLSNEKLRHDIEVNRSTSENCPTLEGIAWNVAEALIKEGKERGHIL